jgi:predicted ArsR family transcriptional regulator
VTEDGMVIPLRVSPVAHETPAQNDSVMNAADKSGLSPVTIKRIRSALHFLGVAEITNHDLADALQVTVANANRFLNALVANGFAEITGIRKSTSKGRPSRIYRIDL